MFVSFVRQRRAITFLEIVIAVLILAIAMIPLFGLMSRETIETDRNASQAFAINKASEILNSVIDNIPFVALRQGNPGYVRVNDLPERLSSSYDDTWAKNLMKMLFGSAEKDSAGYLCRGILTDSRGIHYLVHLRVEDVASGEADKRPETRQIGNGFPANKPADFSEVNNLAFAFLKNPPKLESSTWFEEYAENQDESDAGKPLTELDLFSGKGVSEPSDSLYLDAKFVNPTAVRYTQNQISKKVPYNAGEQFSYCTMKKLLIQVQWNLDQKFFSTPEETSGRVQRIHLMTIKGDIDS